MTQLFQFTEDAGPYSVGVQVIEQYDHSRSFRLATDEFGTPYHGERSRPIQTVIWYPTGQSSARPMTVSDYAELWSTETSFGDPRTSVLAKESLAAMKPTLAMPLRGVRDAPPCSGRFPVIIYAPSFSSVSWENADLCEYIASHGYVVIAGPSLGAASRAMTGDVTGLNAQVGDIAYLIAYAHTLTNADVSELAVVGFSWGGLSNLFAAARDSRIKALIALDGSLRYFPGIVREAGDVRPKKMTIPLLYFAQHDHSLEERDRFSADPRTQGPNVLNAWTQGDLVYVHMLGLSHEEYGSVLQRNEDMWRRLFRDCPMMKADYGREDGITGYGWMARYSLQFLDAYLKHDVTAMGFLLRTPAENGVPRHVMAISYRPARSWLASFEGFREEIGRKGFEHAGEMYASILQQTPEFKLDENAVNAWAEELIDGNHLLEAITLLRLNVEMYPQSSSAHASLGRSYEKSGQKQLAIASYRRALDLDPINARLRSELADLNSRT